MIWNKSSITPFVGFPKPISDDFLAVPTTDGASAVLAAQRLRTHPI